MCSSTKRRPLALVPDSMSLSPLALGIDLGGTKTALAVIEFPSGRILQRETIPTRAERGPANLLQELASVATRLVSTPVGSVGLGICELVTGRGEIASNYTVQWTTEQVRKALGHLGPLTVEADVRAGALAESVFGAGRNCELFLYVTIGTGISSCLMIKGRPYLGARGAVGTMASSPLAGTLDLSGGGSTLEELSAGPALHSRFRALGGQAANTEEVLRKAEQGEPRASEVVQLGALNLGAQIGLLVNTLDPEMVVLGGGLGTTPGLFFSALQKAAHRCIWSELHRDLPIVQARTGKDAGVVGAALAGWLGAGGKIS